MGIGIPQNASAQETTEDLIRKAGTFDSWVVREIKESGIIGGHVKHLYEIAPSDTVKGEIPYVNPEGWYWSTSNVMAIVSRITKTSCSVFPEHRGYGNGTCARLETTLEKVKVLGIINLNVIAGGTIYLGQMKEPIRDTKNPQAKLVTGIPFTKKPRAIRFDYKVTVGHNRLRASGVGSPKKLGDDDYAECVVMLQKRWEDEQGNVYAKRVGTGYYRFTESKAEWTNGFEVPIHYGDITGEDYYRDYMKLIPEELQNYTLNSKGEAVPIQEVEWGAPEDAPTHLITRFSASHGEAYVGDPSNRLWLDNIEFVF